MSSKDLLKAVNDGKRIIVATLQKFSVIYDLVGVRQAKPLRLLLMRRTIAKLVRMQ